MKAIHVSMPFSNIIYETSCQVRCMILDAWGWCTGTTQRDGMGREEWGGFRICLLSIYVMGFPGGTVVKNLPANAGDTRDAGLIPMSGRCPEEGNGNSLQYSCLENSIDRGVWQAPVHEVTKSQTQLSNWAHSTYTTHIHSNQTDMCEMQTGCISSA